MLLIRSLMSCVGKDRSTRASPSIGPLALEVADAAAEQHHLPDRQLRRGVRLNRRRDAVGDFGRLGGGDRRTEGEKAGRDNRGGAGGQHQQEGAFH